MVSLAASSIACGRATHGTAMPERPPPAVGNPLADATLFVDPGSQAVQRASGPDAELVRKIAEQPQADWIGDWTPDVTAAVRSRVQQAEQAGALRVLVAYNLPFRDCGLYSAGGAAGAKAYRAWIDDFAAGLVGATAVVILEPDALGHLDQCLPPDAQQQRLELMRYAVRVLRRNPGTYVYIDAGHARWMPVEIAGQRLRDAGIDDAHGFSLNVSNFVATDESVAYGKRVATALNGIGFVVDTGRNGQGSAGAEAWCNPPGRGLGVAPSTSTGDALVHAYLWIKRPGESDGTCNDGPAAGQWFHGAALELARNAQM